MKIGDRIRFFRIQQNKTQEDLASGVISVSYLSKIENNQSLPSLEVVDMLCERLGIRFIDEEEPTLLDELNDWYKMLVGGDKEEIEKLYPLMKEKSNTSKDSTSLVYFMLFELRYYLHLRKMNEAKKSLDKLHEISDIFTEDLNYYLSKFSGLFHYIEEKYSEAYDFYKKAESILIRNVFEKWEEADLYYSLGLTSSQLWKASLCINYTNQALAIYQAHYNYKRSAECQILLGISYRRSNEFKKAEESYILADKIATTLNNANIKGFIHHNLGYLYSIQGKTDLAIKHYEKSICFHEVENYKQTYPSIYSIIVAYYNNNDFKNGIKWVNKGFEKLVDAEDEEYYYHFKCYRYLMTEQTPEFEDFLKEKVIPFFEANKSFKYVADYSEILSLYYEKKYKYKQASFYLKVSNNALKKISNI
ncbi:transcriptional regulator with XRE-family HTH domain [Bacillus mesophilus]|uniref:Helix-turn-helix transcriptional regulator n=1 Tax=Bacillus mesophilus TaxID=1808955 RepID=A0A6M0QE54_9BACI|nr:helix-turn-helix transcriptional regulator [Bacillus mesophilus]MBM7663231.1 transcriptional regulator with XRE-family HTH domain [Bacillus mesophilus]NEY73930.1 helix-turn-helix transcriptional regulator [Bacillus mesophilus]